MPNTPPRKPARQVPSGERIKQMLTPSMTGAMPDAAPTGAPPVSFRQAAMQNYPYKASDYTPEELARYGDVLLRDQYANSFPSRTDLSGEDYIALGLAGEGYRTTPAYAKQDSVYTAQRLIDERIAERRALMNDLMQKLNMRMGK